MWATGAKGLVVLRGPELPRGGCETASRGIGLSLASLHIYVIALVCRVVLEATDGKIRLLHPVLSPCRTPGSMEAAHLGGGLSQRPRRSESFPLRSHKESLGLANSGAAVFVACAVGVVVGLPRRYYRAGPPPTTHHKVRPGSLSLHHRTRFLFLVGKRVRATA